jgi:hypothetical protein
MQLMMQLMNNIPTGWPPWSILIGIIIVYFLFPGLAKKLGRQHLEKDLVAEINQYLQMKKLYFEVQALKKEKDLPDVEFPGEKRLRAKLSELNEVAERSKSELIYIDRLKYNMMGASAFFVTTMMIGLLSGHTLLKPILPI